MKPKTLSIVGVNAPFSFCVLIPKRFFFFRDLGFANQKLHGPYLGDQASCQQIRQNRHIPQAGDLIQVNIALERGAEIVIRISKV